MITNVIQQVFTLLIYMIVGFSFGKSDKRMVKSAKYLSKLLIFILCPTMIINSFLKMEYEVNAAKEIFIFCAVTIVAQLLFFLILFIIYHKKYDDAKYRILSASSVLGNVGFLGLPIITSIFPNEPIAMCFSSIFVFSMNLLTFTIGEFMITNNKKYISIKSAILNPTTIGFIIAMPLFFLNIHLPVVIGSTINFIAKLVTPVCMIILGIRLSQMSLKKTFTSKVAYLTCLLKLIVFPFFALLLVKFIPIFSETFKSCLFILCMMPTGAIICSLAEIHELEREEAANVVLLTTLLCMITIPLLTLVIL